VSNFDCTADPYNRFAYLCSIVSSWPRDRVPDNLDVTFPSQEFHWRFSSGDSTFATFDPGRYFTPPDCKLIWKSLFTKTPVLIVCPDSEVATNVMFSILGLMSPMEYRDGFCLWLTVQDPRFVSIVSEQSNLSLVATDAAVLVEASDYFRVVFRVTNRIQPMVENIASSFHLKMKRTLSIAEFVLDNSLMCDSYFDFLEIPILKPSLASELVEFKKFDLPTLEEFEAWEKTETFRYWRKKRESLERLRDAILSRDPREVLRDKGFDQLLMIQQRIRQLKKDFARDVHVMAVLKRHTRIVERKLREVPL
jgi:hypothetical protein